MAFGVLLGLFWSRVLNFLQKVWIRELKKRHTKITSKIEEKGSRGAGGEMSVNP